MEKNIKQDKSKCIKIVLFGPESTGKTTLGLDLAKYYKTYLVKEFARNYLQKKWDDKKMKCDKNDLIQIAIEQLKSENKLSKIANKILFCDTNILVTKIWSETHFDGYCDPFLNKISNNTNYDLYILTDIDIPWEKDDLRDRPYDRKSMFNYYRDELVKNDLNFFLVSGSKEARLRKSILKIDKFISLNKKYS